MTIPESLNKEPFLTAWTTFQGYRTENKVPLTELAGQIILNRFVRWGYTPLQATESLEQSMLATSKKDGKPWIGVYQIKDGAGRIDGKIYVLDGFGTKVEKTDAQLDALKLKYKEDLRYDEKERCYWIKR